MFIECVYNVVITEFTYDGVYTQLSGVTTNTYAFDSRDDAVKFGQQRHGFFAKEFKDYDGFDSLGCSEGGDWSLYVNSSKNSNHHIKLLLVKCQIHANPILRVSRTSGVTETSKQDEPSKEVLVDKVAEPAKPVAEDPHGNHIRWWNWFSK